MEYRIHVACDSQDGPSVEQCRSTGAKCNRYLSFFLEFVTFKIFIGAYLFYWVSQEVCLDFPYRMENMNELFGQLSTIVC